jgi:hypothetical protein
MTGTISESDWKLFCRFRLLALERFCERIFRDIGPIAAQTDKNWHERYKSLYRLVIESDGDLAKVFDDFRRSTAYFQLKQMRVLGLLTDEEVMQFSSTARSWCDSVE